MISCTENCELKEWKRLASMEAVLSKQLVQVRSQMNACIAACRLPPELLREIFILLRDDAEPKLMVPLSHVCSVWRQAALGYQDLWTGINLMNTALTDMFIRRSGNAPLSLCLDERESLDLGAIRHSIARLTHIEAYMAEPLMVKLCEFLSDAQVDNLVSLDLATPLDSEEFHTNIHLPSLSHSLHTLRRLSLWQVKPSQWSSIGACKGLRSLTLNHHYYVDSDKRDPLPSMNQFLDILESLPLLQELNLTLSGVEPLSQLVTTYPIHQRSVALPNLRHLYIKLKKVIDIGYLLAHLTIPETARVQVEVEKKLPLPVASLLTCLPSDFSNLRFLGTTTSIQLGEAEPGQGLSLKAFGEASAYGNEPCFEVSARSNDLSGLFRATLLHLGSIFRHTRTTTLKIYLQDDYAYSLPAIEDWVQPLLHLPTITSLRLYHARSSRPLQPADPVLEEHIVKLVGALTVTFPAAPYQLLPALTTLQLFNFPRVTPREIRHEILDEELKRLMQARRKATEGRTPFDILIDGTRFGL
ncbi:hypothetical protein EIP91_008401 [Steccherinum ochraceum]|uniref:F-box domain-containing protein n=1 Tax=Steccherinum ochraceum TaxID=92696 RepID=A0A4R0R589_9APHY|nr:hypothetical protein EIP91_008401 [Steccherinum ochraceum]